MKFSLFILVMNLKIQEWEVRDDKVENKYDNLKCLFGDEVKWISAHFSPFLRGLHSQGGVIRSIGWHAGPPLDGSHLYH